MTDPADDDRPMPFPRPTGRDAWPGPTLVVFGFLAAALWLNAAVNHFRFNVALAVLASLPLLVLAARGAGIARANARAEAQTTAVIPPST